MKRLAKDLAAELAEVLRARQRCNAQAAKSLCELGAYLSCRQCGKVEKLTEEDVRIYLSCGWPKCCEGTMELKR
jgi:hypothetical protein